MIKWGGGVGEGETGKSHSRFLDILDFQASDLMIQRTAGIFAEREIVREVGMRTER